MIDGSLSRGSGRNASSGKDENFIAGAFDGVLRHTGATMLDRAGPDRGSPALPIQFCRPGSAICRCICASTGSGMIPANAAWTLFMNPDTTPASPFCIAS